MTDQPTEEEYAEVNPDGLTDWRVHWAHIDAAGKIVSWGTSLGSDTFLQTLEEGLTAVARPEHVNGWDGWVYRDEEWVQIEEVSPL